MEYTYFTFDGITSSTYNLVIQNSGEDLSYPSQPEFENQITSPLYQGTSYLTGVNKKDRTFTFNCWTDSLSRKQVIDLQRWLNVDKIGYLILDYNTNFQYRVKLSNISAFKHLAVNEDSTVNYEFELSFITIGDPAAISIVAYNSATNGATNVDGFVIGNTAANTAINSASYTDLYLYNFYTQPFSMNFAANNVTDLNIYKNGVSHYNYSTLPSGNYIIDSKYGFCLANSGTNLAETLTETVCETNLGPMFIEPNMITFNGVINGSNINNFSATSNMRFIYPDTGVMYNNIASLITAANQANTTSLVFKYTLPTMITIPVGVTFSFNYRDSF